MKRVVLLVSALATVSLAPHARADEGPVKPAADPSQARRDRFAGRWTWAGGPDEVAARDAAVEKGIASLFFAIRGIARSRIKSSVEIRPKLGFAFRGGNIVVSTSGKADVVSPEDGSTIPFKGDDGTPVKLTQRFASDGQLEQTFRGEEGGRTGTFTLAPDGKTLRATYKLFSPKLSTPIVYTLTYRRD